MQNAKNHELQRGILAWETVVCKEEGTGPCWPLGRVPLAGACFSPDLSFLVSGMGGG